MNRPSPATYLAGNLVVLLGLGALTAWACYEATQTGEWVGAGVLLLFLVGAGKARERLTAYADWKRRWDSYGDAPQRSSLPSAAARTVLGILLVVGAVGYLAANADKPDYRAGLAVMAGVLVLALVVVLARGVGRLRSRRALATAPKIEPVAICLGRPSTPSNALDRAYAALPPHCQALLQRH